MLRLKRKATKLIENRTKGVIEKRFVTSVINDFEFEGVFYSVCLGHSMKTGDYSVKTYDNKKELKDYLQMDWLLLVDKKSFDYSRYMKYSLDNKFALIQYKSAYNSGEIGMSAIYNTNVGFVLEDVPQNSPVFGIITYNVLEQLKKVLQ